jgi:hypothetical protein
VRLALTAILAIAAAPVSTPLLIITGFFMTKG